MGIRRRAQGSLEYVFLFAVALLLMAMAFAFVLFWPTFIHSMENQRSDYEWSNARPFSVKNHAMVPNKLVFEIVNNEPVTLTLKNVWVEGISLNFYNHTTPFTWFATPMCPGSNCTMVIRPGEKRVISTDDFPVLISNPCIDELGVYGEGRIYKFDLAFSYLGRDPTLTYSQMSPFQLMGECSSG